MAHGERKKRRMLRSSIGSNAPACRCHLRNLVAFLREIEVIYCAFRIFCAIIIKVKVVSGGDIMSKHIVTINSSSLQDSIKFEGCSECQTSCQSACKTSCTIGNLLCTEQEEAEVA